MVLPRSVCLEKGVRYTLRLEFTSYADKNIIPGVSNAYILIDSVSKDRLIVLIWNKDRKPSTILYWVFLIQVALLPRYNSLDMFVDGDPASILRKQMYERYHCHESAKSVSRPAMSEMCAKLILSMSAIINNGALREFPK